MIAIIQIGVKLESHLKDFGLSTANMGVSLMDNIASTGAVITLASKNIASSAGKSLVNIGGLTGNMGLSTLGSRVPVQMYVKCLEQILLQVILRNLRENPWNLQSRMMDYLEIKRCKEPLHT